MNLDQDVKDLGSLRYFDQNSNQLSPEIQVLFVESCVRFKKTCLTAHEAASTSKNHFNFADHIGAATQTGYRSFEAIATCQLLRSLVDRRTDSELEIIEIKNLVELRQTIPETFMVFDVCHYHKHGFDSPRWAILRR